MHGKHLADDEPMAEMNMIPLIDISLTLLIILMVTTVFVRQPGVKLKLPETVTREGEPETPKDTVVMVTADGKFFLDGRPTDRTGLRGGLTQLAKKNKQARVLVKGDRDVVYARVMDVMDTVRQAGLTRVVLPTEQKPAGEPPAPAGSSTETSREARDASAPS